MTYLNIAECGIIEFEENALIGLQNLKHFVCTGCDLHVISSKVFSHLRFLESIEFSFCEYLKLSDVAKAITELPSKTHLQNLNLTGIGRRRSQDLTVIDKQVMTSLKGTSLKIIDLTASSIKWADSGLFNYIPHIQVLNLSLSIT